MLLPTGLPPSQVDYEHLDHEPSAVLLNIAPGPAGEPLVTVRGPEGEGGAWQREGQLSSRLTAPPGRHSRCALVDPCMLASPKSTPHTILTRLQAMAGPEDAIYPQAEQRAVAPNARMPLNPRFWSSFYVTQLRGKTAAGTFESRKVGWERWAQAAEQVQRVTAVAGSGRAPHEPPRLPASASTRSPTCRWLRARQLRPPALHPTISTR